MWGLGFGVWGLGFVYRGVGSVGSWRIKNTFCVYCVRNGPRLVDYNHKLVCIPPKHTSPFSGLK